MNELEMKLQELQDKLKTTTEAKAKELIASEIKTVRDELKAFESIKGDIDEIKTWKVSKDEADKKNQEWIDKQISDKAAQKNNNKTKSFSAAFAEAIDEAFTKKAAEIKAFATDKDAKLTIDLKAVGDMNISSNLTGDGVASYSQKQGLVPANKINFRDLVPTSPSPTGIYVHYRETGSEGSISVQTEGSDKTQIDYDLTEVKTVSDYIAGYARFSKQMMYQLPFIQNTLPRMLMRDFYKKENAQFYSVVVAGATGNATVTPTVDIEQVVAWIANQLNADFTPSFGIVNFTDWQNLLLTKPTDYSVPGGVTIDANGNIRICGVPIIGASWATADTFMLIDADFIERVETESLRVEFSYEDYKNFTQNKITARVECFEDLNLLRTDAHIVGDFGNVA